MFGVDESDDDGQLPPLIKILVASDIHLGYAEKDALRGRDSMRTFEEILQIASERDVDMILLGGDLFHDGKPSRVAHANCIEYLRKYCFNDRPVNLELISDPTVNFRDSLFPHVNYMDPNLNVGIPVFSINGNHDSLDGNNMSDMDMLHATGVINYFGKYPNVAGIEVSPLLLRKRRSDGQETKLMLYGIGAMRDERLHHLFENGKVKFMTFGDKEKFEENSFYKILVLHQNRVKHSRNNYIPEAFLPNMMDLVIWGHEHECLIDPVETAYGFKIMQPGSTVATSLSEGETRQKCVSILHVRGTKMQAERIPLKTVRQFYFEDIILQDTHIKPGRMETQKEVEKYCEERINRLIKRAENEHSGHARQPGKPLIRIRVDYFGGFDIFNIHRFGEKFIDTVANPRDIILFNCKRDKLEKVLVDPLAMAKARRKTAEELNTRVEDMVKAYFDNADKTRKLQLLTESALAGALREFVDKDEKHIFDDVATTQEQKMRARMLEQIKERNLSLSNLDDFLDKIRMLRQQNLEEAEEEDAKLVQEALNQSRIKRPQEGSDDENFNGGAAMINSDNDMEELPSTSSKTPATSAATRSRRGRGGSTRAASKSMSGTKTNTPTQSSRGGRGRGRGKAELQTPQISQFMSSLKTKTTKRRTLVDIDDDDNDGLAILTPPVRSKPARQSPNDGSQDMFD